MPLRIDVIYWLTQCRLDWTSLIYLDDIPFIEDEIARTNVQICLVDHNVLTGSLTRFSPCVIEIIDHHRLSVPEEEMNRFNLLLVKPVGSCSSLVADILMKDSIRIPYLFMKLLYGLSTWDLLRRDMKLACSSTDSNFNIICSTISGLDFEELISAPDFFSAARRFCDIHTAPLLVCIAIGTPRNENTYLQSAEPTECRNSTISSLHSPFFPSRRAIIVYSTDHQDTLRDQLIDHLCRHSSGLELKPVLFDASSRFAKADLTSDDCLNAKISNSLDHFNNHVFAAIIGNMCVTRKVILPLIVEFLYKRNQSFPSGGACAPSSSGTGQNSGTDEPMNNGRPEINFERSLPCIKDSELLDTKACNQFRTVGFFICH
ncbi:unnamed protein product [Protopolystoma xenopodis]|uniref:DHHA2 domain-containing protein n=1 Tax=Protopolystoma xenopodis TaxID=117903 RepID=A0A3S5AQI2_9PLAT|nr:unnamed protein product [Protopolystoma xenopodis]